MTNAQISTAILAKIAEGLSPVDACKAILGADKIDAMIDQLYNELRK